MSTSKQITSMTYLKKWFNRFRQELW